MHNGIDALWERLPKVSFPFLGWGIYCIWNMLMYRYSPVDFPLASDFSHVYYDWSIAITVFVLACLSRFRRGFAPLMMRKGVLPLSAVMLVACTCINFIALECGIESPALSCFAVVVGGVGSALMMMLLNEFFGFVHPKRVILYMATGWIFGAIASAFLYHLTVDYLWIALCCVPVVSALCLWRSYKTLSATEISYMGDRGFSFPWVALVPVVLSSMLKRYAAQLGPVDVSFGVLDGTASVIAGMVVFVGLAVYGGNLNLRIIWKAGIVFCGVSAGCFVFGILGPGIPGIVGAMSMLFSSISYYLLLMLMLAVLANISYRYGVCSLWLFSVEHFFRLSSANAASFGLAIAQGEGVSSWLLDGGFVVMSVAAAFIMAVLFKKYSPDSLWGLSLEDEDSFGANERLGLICDALANEHGLTAREGEILFLCLQRKKPTTIADELFIEVSTVRTHIKHIYAKLGVHSRSELFGLVDSRRQGNPQRVK